jgi:DNA-binding transcriptional LysR family regulator
VGEAERAAAGEFATPRGDLTLTAPIAFGRLHLLPVVGEFLTHYPAIKVRMVLSDRNVHLIDDQIDMALRIGNLEDSTMVATRVGALKRIVCGSPAFLAAHGTPKTPADLESIPCITFDQLAAGAPWLLKGSGRKADQLVSVKCRLAVNTADAAVDAAMAGVGLAQVLSYQAAGPIREKKLKRVLRDFEGDPLPVSLLHAGQGPLPHKMRSFLEFAAPRLRKSIANI